MKHEAALVTSLVVPLIALLFQVREHASCGSSIVSPTVVSTYCGHREDGDEVVDLIVLWRGNPGWFQLSGSGGAGGGGGFSGSGGGGGRVYQFASYGNVSIGFDADFDAGTVKIGEETLPLKGINAILVDFVDEAGARRVVATRAIEPKLPAAGDPNVKVARRSPELLNYLQCHVPMPAPPTSAFSRLRAPVLTVCEKLTP